MTYSTDRFNGSNLVTISKERVFDIIAMNKQGKKPLKLTPDTDEKSLKEGSFSGGDILEDQSITRFDDNRQNQTKKRRKPRKIRPNDPSVSRNRLMDRSSDDE